jgi:hypothetical protein
VLLEATDPESAVHRGRRRGQEMGVGRMIVQFKSEDELESGEPIGKVFVFDEDDPDVDPLDDWMTLSQARQLAEQRGYEFVDEDEPLDDY